MDHLRFDSDIWIKTVGIWKVIARSALTFGDTQIELSVSGKVMGNPNQFSLGVPVVEYNSDLKCYFFDHFQHMKINLFPLKPKS